jgi:alpha-L-rhamnosidase
VCDWLHRTVGGLAPGGPGYATVTVAPRPGGGITWARTEHETPYGSAVVSWRLDGDDFVCDVTVPPNTTATVALPITDATPAVVGSGTAHFRGRYAGSSAPGPYLPRSGAGWRNGPRIRTP